MRCGREPGGPNVDEKGVCPAATGETFSGINKGEKGGRICWLVAGTFCGGVTQGSFAEKKDSCRECAFYRQVQAEEAETKLSFDSIDIVATSHIGLVRIANEDRYLIRQLDNGTLLLAVADGLGGHEAGDYAAEILRGRLAAMPPVPVGREQELLARLAVETDRIILQLAADKPELEGMGTTLLCVLLRDGTAHWVHVGDSRFSIVRDRKLLQITRDQNLARFLVEEGEITREEVPDHYSRHVLDQALGSALEEPETGKVTVQAHDLLLLSTDGLHNQVAEETIASVLSTEAGLAAKVDLLVRSALDVGGKDNITIVAVQLRDLH
jgi:protein phosphatase